MNVEMSAVQLSGIAIYIRQRLQSNFRSFLVFYRKNDKVCPQILVFGQDQRNLFCVPPYSTLKTNEF